jgi:hypothetical protein
MRSSRRCGWFPASAHDLEDRVGPVGIGPELEQRGARVAEADAVPALEGTTLLRGFDDRPTSETGVLRQKSRDGFCVYLYMLNSFRYRSATPSEGVYNYRPA